MGCFNGNVFANGSMLTGDIIGDFPFIASHIADEMLLVIIQYGGRINLSGISLIYGLIGIYIGLIDENCLYIC